MDKYNVFLHPRFTHYWAGGTISACGIQQILLVTTRTRPISTPRQRGRKHAEWISWRGEMLQAHFTDPWVRPAHACAWPYLRHKGKEYSTSAKLGFGFPALSRCCECLGLHLQFWGLISLQNYLDYSYQLLSQDKANQHQTFTAAPWQQAIYFSLEEDTCPKRWLYTFISSFYSLWGSD